MSERKRYTAQEMREMAEHLIEDICDHENECNEYRNTIGSFDLSDCELALRQAADAEEENAQIKARLEAVVKECERINDATFERSINKVVAYKTRVDVASDAICHRILRAARGELETENK